MSDHLTNDRDGVICKFEALVERNPQDCEALESLRDCLRKYGRHAHAVQVAHRLAKVYLQLGHTALGVFEYEDILRVDPSDLEAKRCLELLQAGSGPVAASIPVGAPPASGWDVGSPSDRSDGRDRMFSVFVGSKRLSASVFEQHWSSFTCQRDTICRPFILILAEKGACPIDDSLELLYQASGAPVVPLEQYDLDSQFARSYPFDLCRKHCVLPLDRMSRCVFIATANPFDDAAIGFFQNLHARRETRVQLVQYLVSPLDLIKTLGQVFS